jgi:hypothetical protein
VPKIESQENSGTVTVVTVGVTHGHGAGTVTGRARFVSPRLLRRASSQRSVLEVYDGTSTRHQVTVGQHYQLTEFCTSVILAT